MKRAFLVVAVVSFVALGVLPAVAATPDCDSVVAEAAAPAVAVPGQSAETAALLDEIFAAPVEAELLVATAVFCPKVCCFVEADCDNHCPEPRKCVRTGAGCGRCEWQ